MNIVIIGGTAGIGGATAELLNESGHKVMSFSRNAPSAPISGIEYRQGDILTDPLPESWDEIHGLVYAPGSINLKPFGRLKPEDFQKDYDINVVGAVKALQQLHPMLKKGNGSVVLFSTVAVNQGMSYHASVAAAKGAIEGLTKSLAAEWAPSVRVNAIAPSVTNTPLATRIVGTPERREASEKRHPLQKIGEPEDVAKLAMYLLEASWMTGQIIGIDGGMSTLRA